MTTNSLSTPRRRRTNRVWIIIALVVLALVVGGVTFFLLNHRPTTETDEAESVVEVDSAVDETTDEATSTTDEEDNFNEVPQYEGENPNHLDVLTGSLIHAEPDGSDLVIRVNIDQALNSGTCTLNMTADNGGVYTAEAVIFMSGAVTSSCEGFNVPLASLATSNSWIINIALSSGGKTGTIVGEVRL